MTTKQYLNQIQEMKGLIDDKYKQINEMRDEMTRVSAVRIKDINVQGSGDPDPMASSVAALVDRERELNALIENYIQLQRVLSAQIDAIKKTKLREVLQCRYIHGMTFESTATSINKSWRQTIRIHGSALQEFERKYGKIYL